MKRSRFSEEQIIAVLREQEAGAKTVDVCRRHGISTATGASLVRNRELVEVVERGPG
jgi:hypothetical protein